MNAEEPSGEVSNVSRPLDRGVIVRSAIALSVVGAIAVVIGFFVLQGLRAEQESTRNMACLATMKQLGLAITMYADQHGHYPPPHVRDDADRPRHSWRILLLPLFGDEFASIYEQYRFDEPWNSPHNQRLGAEAPWVYRCPSDNSPPGDTSFLAVVGDETIWPEKGGVRSGIFGVRDGTAETILVVEAAGCGINWLEPRDLPLELAIKGVNQPGKLGIRSNHLREAHVVLADTRVFDIPDGTPGEFIRALLTRSGNEFGGGLSIDVNRELDKWRE